MSMDLLFFIFFCLHQYFQELITHILQGFCQWGNQIISLVPVKYSWRIYAQVFFTGTGKMTGLNGDKFG